MNPMLPSFEQLNIAMVKIGTRALGPGYRSTVWVQGCALHCPGCIAPSWIPQTPANMIDPQKLALILISDPQVTGITISGGEPMLQASGLAEMIKTARRIREVDVICFSGYTLADLQNHDQHPFAASLLAEIDILIDGPYIQANNDDRGLRGSSNQVVHALTARIPKELIENFPRTVELDFIGNQMTFAGVPSRNISQAVEQATRLAHQRKMRSVNYVRP